MALPMHPQPDFGDLLRSWRQHRRVTQLELANLAEVSSRHLSFLETGRSKPSREMVLHLSDRLDVPLRDRNRLLQAAGFAPLYAVRSLVEDEMHSVNDAIAQILDAHQPYPALVVDGHWNLVTANAAAFVLTAHVDPALLEPPVNVVRLSVHPAGLAPHVTNFAPYAAHLLSRLRRQVDRSADPVLRDLLAESIELCGADLPELPPGPGDVVLPMHLRLGDDELSLFSTISMFGAPQDITLEELAIESFYPADAATAAVLRRRAG